MGHPATQPLQRATPGADELRRSFTGTGSYTVGIEEELMLLDPDTLELAPATAKVLEALGEDERFRKELPAAQLEIVTGPAATIGQAIDELRRLRLEVARVTDGWLEVAGSGVHPFAETVGVMSEGEHYEQLVADYGWAALRGMSFGLHVHVSVDDADRALAVFNALRAFLPEIAALAGNAPFFDGEDTGLWSVRPKLAENFPRQGIPPGIESWDAYAEFLRWGARGRAILDAKHVWWEARLNPLHGTLEVRAPDTQTRVADTAGVAAFVQALVAWLGRRYDDGERWRPASDVRIAENRWRALRHGLDGSLVDLETGEPVATRERIASTIELVSETARELGAAQELEQARELLRFNGAERQRAVASERGLHGLVAWMAEQF